MTRREGERARGQGFGVRCFSAAFLCLSVATCSAVDLQVSTSQGLGGYVKSDEWTFVRVTCANQGESFEGVAVVQAFDSRDIELPESYETSVALPRGSRKEFFVYFPTARGASYWRLSLRKRTGRSERILFEERISSPIGPQAQRRFLSINPNEWLMVHVSNDEKELAAGRAALLPRGDIGRHGQFQVAVLSPQELPDRWIGYKAADGLVVDADVFQSPMNDRLGALMEWVGTGGHLVVLPNASSSGRFHADWAKLFGVQIKATDLFGKGLTMAERYTNPPAQTLRTLYEGSPDEVLVGDEQGPILFRVRHGLGTVTFAAMDLSQPLWRDWSSAPLLWRDLLAPTIQSRRVDLRRQYGNNYYDFHSQNVIQGLRQIPELRAPSFFLLGSYLFVYVLVMVVANFIVLRRLDKKEWSLFTFPAIAIVFGMGAYWSGYLVRGGTSVLHQVNLVELAAGESQGATHTYAGYFSATRSPRSLAFPRETFPRYLVFDHRYSGDTERMLPPMRLNEGPNPSAMVPIHVWSMRTFAAEGPIGVEGAIRCNLVLSETNNALQLTGWIENQLAAELAGTFLTAGANGTAAAYSAVSIGRSRFAPSPPQPIGIANLDLSGRTEVNVRLSTQTQAYLLRGNPASNAAFQWWCDARYKPDHVYLVGTIDEADPLGLAMDSARTSHKQQTIVIARVPVTIPPEIKEFGQLWWLPSLVKSEANSLSPMGGTWRQGFNIYGGNVVVRFHLIGHKPGMSLKRLLVQINAIHSQSLQRQSASVLVWDRLAGEWKETKLLEGTDFDAARLFDELSGTVDFKLVAGQGNLQLQSQFIQLTGERECIRRQPAWRTTNNR